MANVKGRFASGLSNWRRLASVAWRAPDDPTIYGTLEADLSKANGYLEKVRESSGEKVTITHLVVKALAEGLRRHPECNALIRRGRVFDREDVDIFMHVAIPPRDGDSGHKTDLSGIVIRGADRKSLVDVAREANKGARATRKEDDPKLKKLKQRFAAVPPGVIASMLRTVAFLQYEWNLDLSSLGFPKDSFGSAMVTNVGVFGIRQGFAPITPFTRIPLLLCVGAAEERPVVREGKVVIRPVLQIVATLDHRLIDGAHGGRLAKTLQGILEDPEKHLGAA